MLTTKTSEQLVRDIGRKQIEEYFPNQKYSYMVERLASGDNFERFVYVATKGVQDLVRKQFTTRGIKLYLENLTKHYIERYLEALEPKLND